MHAGLYAAEREFGLNVRFWHNPRDSNFRRAQAPQPPNFRHYVGRDEGCPAAKTVPDASYRGESELRFSQDVVRNRMSGTARDGGFGALGPLFRSFASGGEFAEWRARSSELFRRGSFRLLLGEHALRSLQ
jgi:hypothetical protein